ncbi:MAG: 16S rRNA (cytosine(1402)-N(4))-methyltransferase RsmH [Deltaproteobacteria bacterium]|nr:16S rRNA (cytosine(1402)-N(4))-methyltransferase RsmH [Deltaproteobacteria bacterium]
MTKEPSDDDGFLSLKEARELRENEGERPWEELFGHAPVLLNETLEGLDIKPDGFYVDATLGSGGVSRSILKVLSPTGRLLALDLDPEPLDWASEWGKGDGRLTLLRGNFADLTKILESRSLGKADGIIADLGLSSRQFLKGDRGFSFKKNGPLDMRINPDSAITAAHMVNNLDPVTLEKIIFQYGGDFYARAMARTIASRREQKPFESTQELAAVAVKVYANKGEKTRIHPATRLFLALRIAVNHEDKSLAKFLSEARGNLKLGGRLLVISFQSEEDSLVKNLFRDERSGFKRIWKKAVGPSLAEIRRNIRSRSAKLRGGMAI